MNMRRKEDFLGMDRDRLHLSPQDKKNAVALSELLKSNPSTAKDSTRCPT